MCFVSLSKSWPTSKICSYYPASTVIIFSVPGDVATSNLWSDPSVLSGPTYEDLTIIFLAQNQCLNIQSCPRPYYENRRCITREKKKENLFWTLLQQGKDKIKNRLSLLADYWVSQDSLVCHNEQLFDKENIEAFRWTEMQLFSSTLWATKNLFLELESIADSTEWASTSYAHDWFEEEVDQGLLKYSVGCFDFQAQSFQYFDSSQRQDLDRTLFKQSRSILNLYVSIYDQHVLSKQSRLYQQHSQHIFVMQLLSFFPIRSANWLFGYPTQLLW